jgi:hypothetical protein
MSIERITRTLGVAPVPAATSTGGSRPGIRVQPSGADTNGALGRTQIPRTTPKAGVVIAGAGVVVTAAVALGFMALGPAKAGHADLAAGVAAPPVSTPAPAAPPAARLVETVETTLAPLAPPALPREEREPPKTVEKSSGTATRHPAVAPAHAGPPPAPVIPPSAPAAAASARPKPAAAPSDSDPFSRLQPL